MNVLSRPTHADQYRMDGIEPSTSHLADRCFLLLSYILYFISWEESVLMAIVTVPKGNRPI